MNADRDAINDRFAVVADLLDISEAVLLLEKLDALDAVEAIATPHGIGRDFLLTGRGRALGSGVERRPGATPPWRLA